MIDFKNLLNKIFGINKHEEKEIALSGRHADWNLKISDLMEDMNNGKRKSISQIEFEWARAYELSLIPENYRFPQKGDLYESTEDQEIDFLTSWTAAYTGSGKSVLLEGERLWIDSEPGYEKPLSIYALPVEYDKLELRMVPEDDRNSQKYSGFYFYIQTTILNEKYRLIETNYHQN